MTSAHRITPAWAIALGGVLSLAAAMGVGRFAFTPLLPLMARDGQLGLASGGWIAAANYVGYLVGALTAARVPLGAAQLARFALLLTAATTAAMALPGMGLWLVLRFVAGVASAWVFVATSVWCLGALAQRGAQAWAGWVYAGVGGGIALTGVHCLVASGLGVTASGLWVQLGVLVLLLAVPVMGVLGLAGEPRFARGHAQSLAGARNTANGPQDAAAAAVGTRQQVAAGRPGPAPAPADAETRGLILCYGVMGFAYILPATFLPAMARSVVDDPRLFGLAWPVFGGMAAASTVLSARLLRHATRLQQWAVCQALMGAGVLLPSLWRNGATIALAALFVGGTFMLITLAGVQEMRQRAPQQAARRVGQITAAFALGQIAGPVASTLLLHVPALASRGLDLALQLSALSLFASAAWLARRAFPAPKSKETRHA